jgi:predicted anti-sigma-YlaC factor YlaD
MVGWQRTTPCERAAEWTSLALDGEITELERAGLARHLDRCESCRASSAAVSVFTAMLRSAPLAERTASVRVIQPRAPARRRAAAVAVAALAAVAAVLTVLPPTGGGSSRNAVDFRSANEQLRFAQEHVRIESTVFLTAESPPVASFASRALL